MKKEVSVDKFNDISPKKRGGKSAVVVVVIILVVILVAIVGWKLYGGGVDITKTNITSGDNSKSPEASKQDIQKILAMVGKHMILPTGEVPQIATISNAVEMAKQQVFFTGAQNGDELIVYLAAKKAIIYSPSRDLIVNVGPVFMNDQPGQATTTQKSVTSVQASSSVKKK